MADEPGLPSEEELREALDRVAVADVLLNALSAVASIGFHRVSSEARDLEQAKLAIDALGAVVPLLKGAVADDVHRDLVQMVANMQLAYAKAAAP